MILSSRTGSRTGTGRMTVREREKNIFGTIWRDQARFGTIRVDSFERSRAWVRVKWGGSGAHGDPQNELSQVRGCRHAVGQGLRGERSGGRRSEERRGRSPQFNKRASGFPEQRRRKQRGMSGRWVPRRRMPTRKMDETQPVPAVFMFDSVRGGGVVRKQVIEGAGCRNNDRDGRSPPR